MLGWGLLASIMLHWAVLDLMRAAAWLPTKPAAAGLQVTLEASRPDAAGISSEKSVAPVATRPAAKPVNAPPQQRAAQDEPSRSLPDKGIQSSGIHVEGLRSGQPAEAMVALRLALAQSLGEQQKPNAGSLPSAMTLWCDFDAAGHLLDVRSESGPISAAVQSWVRRAVAQLVLPETLLGRAFSLDVLLDPGS